jgi:hypothetical protein
MTTFHSFDLRAPLIPSGRTIAESAATTLLGLGLRDSDDIDGDRVELRPVSVLLNYGK